MIKQAAIALCLSLPASIHPTAFAAQEKHTFEVSVDIPTLGFYVIPSEADWIHREQTLPWDIHNSTLLGLRKSFDVKTDGSAIEARLENFPYLTAGGDSRDNIVLRVSFNGKELTQDPTPQEVVSAVEAGAGRRVALEIVPREQPGGYKPGEYNGSVNIVFNVAAPAG
ncbi:MULTISPECIES: CS1 type fimbrial major subunit [Pseudomonas]|uniref:Fimbrial protein n=1 Tax=Pseudomonas aphyarum TaxID=2942629 RepID=A0ABT5PJ60_9PSED|nr:CS1 type fimbrial major subunit [Pseudomonas aphyarum]MDD0970658.1 fimbrial protein [Pseudomonas aphyarum]MDD1123942.1 fimbrial protein [Pseudomonas aphyarum]